MQPFPDRRRSAARRHDAVATATSADRNTAAMVRAVLRRRTSAPAMVQSFADDRDILNYALGLEHLAHAFYRDGLEDLNEVAFAEAGQPDGVWPLVATIRDQEQAHAATLTRAVGVLGGKPVVELAYEFPYESVDELLVLAALLANTSVAAYAGAATHLRNKALLPTILGIHSVEARHAAFLNQLIAVGPFPTATGMPLPRDEVLAIVDPFIAGELEGKP